MARRHVHTARQSLNVQRLRVLAVHPVADAPQQGEVAQAIGSAGLLVTCEIVRRGGSISPEAVGPVQFEEVLVTLKVRHLVDGDRAWIADRLERNWAGRIQIARGRGQDAAALPGLIAMDGERVVGLLAYTWLDDECELVLLDAFEPGRGIGRLLVSSLVDLVAAETPGYVVVTTNDNLDALGFYQRIGFTLTELRPGAVDESRRRKPAISLLAANGIPIRDELVLTMHTRR